MHKTNEYMVVHRCDDKYLIYSLFGAVAQLVEHLLCKQGVVGSSPIRSTNETLKFTLLY